MRKSILIATALCALCLAAHPGTIRAQTTDPPVADPTARVIVKLKADSPLLRAQALSASAVAKSRAEALGKQLGVALVAGAHVSDRSQVVFATGITSA